MEADGDELVALEHHGHHLALVRVRQHRRRRVVVRLAGLALARVQDLEYSRDLLGVRADDVALSDRPHVEHLHKKVCHHLQFRILHNTVNDFRQKSLNAPSLNGKLPRHFIDTFNEFLVKTWLYTIPC